MFTRGQTRAWRRIAAGAVGLTLAAAALLAPSSNALSAAPMAAAAVVAEVPAADILDVDFTTGQTVDRVSGNEPIRYGYPMLNRGTVWFDGEDDGFFYPIDWAPLAEGFSVECMFRWTGPSFRAHTCKGTEGGGMGFEVEPNGSLRFVANIDGSYEKAISSATLQEDRWYHAVGTWDGDTSRVYLNGELVGELATTGAFRAPPESEGVALGGDASGFDKVNLNVESEFAGIRIYSQVLTDTAIADLSHQAWEALPPRPAPSAGVLDIDYGSGQEYDQASGTEPRTFGDPAVAPDTEIGRKVATFDGDDAYLAPIDWPALSGGFTAECVFKVDQPSTDRVYPCAGHGSGGIAFQVTNGTSLEFVPNVGGSYHTVAMPTEVEAGRWYHAVGTWDGEMARLYVDGELVNEVAATGEFGVPSQDGFAVGADAQGQDQVTRNLTGGVAMARIYDLVLDRSEIAWLSDAARTPVQVELASTTPGAGAEVTEAVPFEAAFDVDAAEQLTQRRYELDGERIRFGDLVGPGLSPGPHAITISAVDSSERTLRWSVPFTTSEMADGGGTETGQGDGAVTLSAMAIDPDGGDVTTTFRAATATTIEQGWQGEVVGIPETLDFEFDGREAISESLFPDGETVASPASPRIPFQRFDIAVGDPVDGQAVEWSGVVDPDRAVSLRAWDRLQGKWATLATAQGVADAQTALRGRLRPGLVTDGVAHVMVTGDDPFEDNLAPRDESANDPENRDHLEDPASYDFSFVHHTDTQHSTEGAVGSVNDDFDGVPEPGEETFEKELAVFGESYTDAPEWIAGNAEERKIAFSVHSGDLIQNRTPFADNEFGRAAARKEFEFASSAQQILEDAGVVNQIIAGNHDNSDGDDAGPEAMLNDYFGPERYYAAQENWPEAANASYHAWDEVVDENGNTVTPGTDNSNNYVLFEAGGLEFVAVGLSYGVTQEEADWANSIFEWYSDRNGILVPHSYLRPSTSPDGRGGDLFEDGGVLYEEVVTANPNVFLVLAGHSHGVTTRIETDLGATVDKQHNVVQLVANYQNYEVLAEELWPDLVAADGTIDLDGDGTPDREATDPYQLGAGFFRMLQFDADRGQMSVDTYSPFFDNNYGATEYDPDNRYNGAEDNFTVPVALSSRTTSFETDALTLITPTDEVIGEETVNSGWPASVEWTGLTEGELYAWTATSRTSSGELIRQVTQAGGTFVATAAGTDQTPPVISFPEETTLVEGDSFDPLEGVTVVDNSDGDLLDQVQVTNTVDTTTPGTYIVLYSVKDSVGNQATAIRTVKVTAAPEPDLTATKLIFKGSRAVVGGTATFTAKIRPTAATGTVEFLMSGEDPLCEATLSAGTATCRTDQLPVVDGTFTVDAVYSGDSTHAPSNDTATFRVLKRR